MIDQSFLDGMALGALAALGEGASEPFGTWPFPPMPQPKPLRAVLPITITNQGS